MIFANYVVCSPACIFEGELLYGQDRLHILKGAIRQPLKSTNGVNPPFNAAEDHR